MELIYNGQSFTYTASRSGAAEVIQVLFEQVKQLEAQVNQYSQNSI
jgi:hypothetical protein